MRGGGTFPSPPGKASSSTIPSASETKNWESRRSRDLTCTVQSPLLTPPIPEKVPALSPHCPHHSSLLAHCQSQSLESRMATADGHHSCLPCPYMPFLSLPAGMALQQSCLSQLPACLPAVMTEQDPLIHDRSASTTRLLLCSSSQPDPSQPLWDPWTLHAFSPSCPITTKLFPSLSPTSVPNKLLTPQPHTWDHSLSSNPPDAMTSLPGKVFADPVTCSPNPSLSHRQVGWQVPRISGWQRCCHAPTWHLHTVLLYSALVTEVTQMDFALPRAQNTFVPLKKPNNGPDLSGV